jgi:hypothetical protein
MKYAIDQKKTLTFQQELESRIGKKFQLKINDNRSTMLSVKWEPDCTKVSLHRMFLKAPQNVMQELVHYLKGKNKKLAPNIKAYIEHNLQKLDYSHELDLSALQTKGKVYDLQKIYDDLNETYFGGSLELYITWFGSKTKRSRQRITFGLFHDALRLIKMNRMVDDKYFPPYFVAYVIYHEMLHYVCPTYVDANGQKHIHSKEFKLREKKFAYYREAQMWLKENQSNLFDADY